MQVALGVFGGLGRNRTLLCRWVENSKSTNKNTNKKKSVSFTALNAPHFWGRWGFAHGLLFFKQQALNQKVQVGVCCWTASGFQQQVQPQKISPGSRHGMAVRHCSLCSGHAQAYWRGFMGHQRQQPLQRVVCLRQAMYQPGLVAAACRPSCALPAPSPVVQRLDCFRHAGHFLRVRNSVVSKGLHL